MQRPHVLCCGAVLCGAVLCCGGHGDGYAVLCCAVLSPVGGGHGDGCAVRTARGGRALLRGWHKASLLVTCLQRWPVLLGFGRAVDRFVRAFRGAERFSVIFYNTAEDEGEQQQQQQHGSEVEAVAASVS